MSTNHNSKKTLTQDLAAVDDLHEVRRDEPVLLHSGKSDRRDLPGPEGDQAGSATAKVPRNLAGEHPSLTAIFNIGEAPCSGCQLLQHRPELSQGLYIQSSSRPSA